MKQNAKSLNLPLTGYLATNPGFPVPPSAVGVLDLRRVSRAMQETLVFLRFGALPPGGAFVLVTGEDPFRFYELLENGRKGRFLWEMLEEGPERWRARIEKRRTA